MELKIITTQVSINTVEKLLASCHPGQHNSKHLTFLNKINQPNGPFPTLGNHLFDNGLSHLIKTAHLFFTTSAIYLIHMQN